jgi:threonyl-tRNA synthetase
VRKHGGEDLGKMKLEDFVELIKKEINNALEK